MAAVGEKRDLSETFDIMATAAAYAGRRKSRVSPLDLLELLPTYRNAMSDAHGSIKAYPGAYRQGLLALLELAGVLFAEGALLGGACLLYAEDVKIGLGGGHRVVWMDVTGPTAIRRQALEGEPTSGEILPGRLYLELGEDEHLPLHPLLHYQPGEIVDRVFYLNRARGGKSGIQFLCYATGDFYLPGRDEVGGHLVKDLRELLSWVTSRKIESDELEELAAQSRSDAREKESEIALEEEPPAGSVFGDFEILGELGRGGMAVVYQARQRSLGRTVALKVLPPALRDDYVALARFKQEVRALSHCDHPNVVKVFSSGEAEGTLYYAMEFIDGGDLGAIAHTLRRYRSSSNEALREGHFDRAASSATSRSATSVTEGLPAAEPVEREPVAGLEEGRDISFRLAGVIRDAARAAHHIHDQGIIHRDLKPQNIMVTREDHRPVIMDLGLAKVAGVSRSLTLEKGSILGTLRYMPPEQLQRNLLEVDARADIYALGAVLYELACYRPMMDGETEERLTTQIIFEEPPAPDKVNPRLPTDLATIITRATQKDPKARYASAAEFADDLDRFVHGEAIHARPPTPGYILRLFVKRHAAAVTAACLALLLVLTVLVVWLVVVRSAYQREAEERREKEVALEKAEDALDRANENLARMFLEKAERALAVGAYQRAAVAAAASLEIAESPVARGKLYAARTSAPGPPVWTTPRGAGWVRSVAFSPDGRWFATGSSDTILRLWDAESGREAAQLKGHGGAILAVAFSSDGRLLASASEDATIRLWDVALRKQTALLKGHDAAVNSVAFDPTLGRLASASMDRTIRIWDAGKGEEVSILAGLESRAESVAFSPDGELLAAALRDGLVRMWDPAAGAEIESIDGHAGRVLSVAFCPPDGASLAAAYEDRTIRIWDVATRVQEALFQGHAERITAIVLSPDGSRLASASYDSTIRLWDVKPGREVNRLEGHEAVVYSIAYSADGKRLLSGSFDGSVRLWDASTGKEIARLGGHGGTVWCVAVSPDGKQVASASADKTIRIWDRVTGRELGRLEGHGGVVYTLAFHPDGGMLASGSDDCSVRLWDPAGTERLKRLDGHTSCVAAVAFSPDGRLLASGSADRTIRLWKVATGEVLKVLEGHTGTAREVCFSADGSLLASGSYDGTVRLWDIPSRNALAVLEGHAGEVDTVAFSRDGGTLASGSEDRTVRFWDVAARRPAGALEKGTGAVLSLAFQPDGRALAAGCADRTIRLVEPESGRELLRLEGHTGVVRSLAFTPDATQTVSGSQDGTVRLWNVEAPPRLFSLRGHRGRVNSVAFGPDSSLLASGSSDRTVRLWDLATGKAAQLEGHTSLVYSVAFRLDGSRLASASWRGPIRVWNLVTRRLVQQLGGRAFPQTHAVAFSPDGSLAAGTFWEGGALWLWDATASGGRRELKGHEGTVLSVAFSPDGRWFASGSDDTTIRLWEAGLILESREGLPSRIETETGLELERTEIAPCFTNRLTPLLDR